jgi:hypothetical protein
VRDLVMRCDGTGLAPGLARRRPGGGVLGRFREEPTVKKLNTKKKPLKIARLTVKSGVRAALEVPNPVITISP